MTHFHLSDVNISGFSAANTKKGELAKIVWRGGLTSDQPEFYKFMEGVSQLVAEKSSDKIASYELNQAATVLLVVHADKTADLYINSARMAAEALAKKEAKEGELVSANVIADIRRLRILDLSLLPSDKILVCFKVGWKFALYFDLGDQRDLDIETMEISMAHLYRLLAFEDSYAAMSDEVVFQQLVAAGWFPFLEIQGGQFSALYRAFRDDFCIDEQRKKLVDSFDLSRIQQLGTRWKSRAPLARRAAILEAALSAYARDDSISCLKILLTEIEGIIRDAHIVEKQAGAKIAELLEYATARGIRRAEGEATLFFPRSFLRYLKESTFGQFDAVAGTGIFNSRHSVGHGAALPEHYTKERALQAVLTVDQLSFYLA